MLTTSVDVPEPPVMVLGVNVAVAAVGRPLAVSATFCEKPEVGVTVIWYPVAPPTVTVCSTGDVLRVKEPVGAVTESDDEAECVMPLLMPVTLNV